jgi:RND family efflux transporter MFP subunit
VRIHSAQEEDIYENAGSELIADRRWTGAGKTRSGLIGGRAPKIAASALALLLLGGAWATWPWNRDQLIRRSAEFLGQNRTSQILAASGVIQPIDVTIVRPEAAGTINAVTCNIGDEVKAGQVCATIDARTYEAALQHAKADLTAAQAQSASGADALAAAKRALERSEMQAKRKTTSSALVEKKRKVYDQARALADEADALIGKRLEALHVAEKNLAKTNIVAPVDGTIIARDVESGLITMPDAAAALFRIARDLTVVDVRASYSVADLTALRLGDKARFTLEALPSREFTGEIIRIGAVGRTSVAKDANDQDGATNVIIRAANPDRSLKPGMKAAIKVDLK